MSAYKDILVAETHRRIIDESIPRIKKCLAELDEKAIWYKPNDNSNSVGNLVLHLCGNVTQWIGSGLGKKPDNRTRDLEFLEKGPLPTSRLLDELQKLEELLNEVLSNITDDMLLGIHDVQVYKETGTSILVHVIEHFSYHTGQIAFFTKWRKDVDLGFYEEDLG